MKELQTLKTDLKKTRIVTQQLGNDIDENQVLLKVERFSFKYSLMKKLDLYKKRTKGMNDEQYKELRI